jgi:hypothetical protein
LNKEDLESWLSSEVTREYVKYIQQELDENKDLSNSPLLNQSIQYGTAASVEQLGIDSLSRASAVKALEFALDKENFRMFCLGGGDA